MAERLKWVQICETCDGRGSVEDEDDLPYTCLNCDGTGEEPGHAQWGGPRNLPSTENTRR